MIKVGICEDEKITRNFIARMLAQYFKSREIVYQLREYESGKEYIEQRDETDILILDIEMEGITGIQLKDWLWKEDEDVKILFVTNHMEEMQEAFGRNVYGFLQKPLEQSPFEKYLNRMVEDIEENRGLVIKGVDQEYVMKMKDILYFVSENKYSRVVVQGTKYFCVKGLGQWEEELKEQSFFRCHKCYLVNFRNIYKIGDEICMTNGDKIPVSRRKGKELKDSYREYIIRKAR